MPLKKTSAPKNTSVRPAAKQPSRNTGAARNNNTSTAGFGANFLAAGAQVGTAAIAARAAQDTLDKLTENPLLLAAVAGVALVFLMR